MWEFLGIVVEAVATIFPVSWWYGDSNEEHRGCFWAVVFFILLCIVIGVIVWLVMRS